MAGTPTHVNSWDGLLTPIAYGVAMSTTMGVGGGAASTAWPSAGRAIYFPLNLPWAYTASRVFWANGAGVTGTVDIGIYDANFNALFRLGGSARTNSNALDYANASFALNPGSYWLAISLSNTDTMLASTTGGVNLEGYRQLGFLQQDAASPLPATMTPAAYTNLYLPLFGFTRTSSGF